MDNIITKPSPASPQELSSLLTESGNNEKKKYSSYQIVHLTSKAHPLKWKKSKIENFLEIFLNYAKLE